MTASPMTAPPRLVVRDLRARAAGVEVLKGVSLEVRRGEVLAIIGPAGSGKTTLLRSLNRLNDLTPEVEVSGDVLLDAASVYAPETDVAELRRRVGMVFATPIPLPLSILENCLFGRRLSGGERRESLEAAAERALRAAYLWDEVKDRLEMPGMRLSGGQQQRLCLARTLALEPDVLLLDEPCSGLDPISTARIEEALLELKRDMAIVLVTNNVKQAARASDRTAFLLQGELVEVGDTATIFTNPADERTADYVSGRFG